jgi:hypothetical protein
MDYQKNNNIEPCEIDDIWPHLIQEKNGNIV